jgi:hypothetical protein
MVHKKKLCSHKQCPYFMVDIVSTEHLGCRGVSFYLTDLLMKPFTRYTITHFRHCKATKPSEICCH